MKTTYGFDSQARIRCIVRNDDNDEAFENPGSPDTSDCAGPTASQKIRIDYGASSITKTVTSVLSTDTTEVENLDGTTLLPTSIVMTGWTQDIAGALVEQTRTTTMGYDSIGRPTETNGPLADSVALDKTTTTYHAFDGAWPYNIGHVHQVTRFVGTESANTPLTTTYTEYDLFGVPHKVTGPNGDYVRYTDVLGSNRLEWTIGHYSSTDVLLGTSTVKLNANGTVRSTQDPDGVCLTFEYADGSGYVGAPTKIRRSNTSCGVLPIDENDGEVEIRTYMSGDKSRLASVTRKTDGNTEFTYSGFTYDIHRRIEKATTLDSASPFEFGYTDVLPTSVKAPGAPAAGSWRTDTTADALARPTSLVRFIDATNTQTYLYSYASPMSPRPSQLARGRNGLPISITTFVYDDFGRLIETTVPEAGVPGSPSPTRYEYDAADRMIKKRVGTGGAAVRTSVYSHDSLGRTTFVDHDTEHPVDCATAPAGTPIQDEEYRYDDCTGDAPAGFTCSDALGRLTISRAILQCGSSQNVVKRGRWYQYTKWGEVYKVAYATVIGNVIGTPAIARYGYTAAGRLQYWLSPTNAAFGTQYVFGTADGRATTIETTEAAPIASSLTYRAFGGLTQLITASVQPVGGGGRTRTLQLAASFRSDDAFQLLDWTQVSNGSHPSINVVTQTMNYGPAGLISTRTDQADALSSRYYGYDALLRMTCEVRGTNPGYCVEKKAAGLYTYGDGQSATSPADVRMTSYIGGAGATGHSYTSPSTETYSYVSGSGQVQGITRSGSNLVLSHDLLGRRTYDYDSSDPTKSRRDYTYLPNGQLGTVSGQTSAEVPYSITMRYDAEGRPLTISDSVQGDFELFWDDADRLIAVSINSGAIRWHYHYLGSSLLAATREIGGNVKRFWAATDERGFVYRFLDEQGATFWQARWDATGWRAIVGTPQPNMWVPFALPGQIILDGTRAYAGTSGTLVRPEIALNRWRAHDPLFGAFLQPDPLDSTGRDNPEGYIYARSVFPVLTDPTGAEAIRPKNIRPSCTAEQKSRLQQEANRAWSDIESCHHGLCGDPEFKRATRWVLESANYTCLTEHDNEWLRLYEMEVIWGGWLDSARWLDVTVAWSRWNVLRPWFPFAPDDRPGIMGFTDKAFEDPRWVLGDGNCLKRLVAHEAMHGAHYHTQPSVDRTTEHARMKKTEEDCIACP